MENDDLRATLPVFPTRSASAGPHRVRVDGLVGRALELTPADLEVLAHQTLHDDFTCLEGWTVPGLKWSGVPLETVLDLAQVSTAARWVQASAGDFSLPLALDNARRALLALRLGDDLLSVEHGGPVRLVVPGRECYTSIKWLDRIELRDCPAPDTARSIALSRLPSR